MFSISAALCAICCGMRPSPDRTGLSSRIHQPFRCITLSFILIDGVIYPFVLSFTHYNQFPFFTQVNSEVTAFLTNISRNAAVFVDGREKKLLFMERTVAVKKLLFVK